MPDTNEFINKLMNKKDDDLDSLLSYADGRKNDTENSHDAETILDELLNESQSSTRGNNHPEYTALPDVSLSSESRNFHHVYFMTDTAEYITYGSICEFGEEETAPVISDDADLTTASEIPETDTDDDISRNYKNAADISASQPDDYLAADTEYQDNLSGFDKFLAEQENRHPKFYFILGLSIFIIVMLGLISCAYLGLNAMKNFADNYRSGI